MSRAADKSRTEGDPLLWTGALVVLGVAVTWLAMARPWHTTTPILEPPPQGDAAGVESAPRVTSAAMAAFADPLRLARLAYDAGMLTEPVEYSAWTLYARALEDDPASTEAEEGLRLVAAELLSRGAVAVEQGRYDDARAVIERILAAVPEHEDARLLAAAIDARVEQRSQELRSSAQAAAATTRARARAPDPDPFAEQHALFESALRANRLLTPAGDNARDILSTLRRLDAENPATLAAGESLFHELLRRAHQAVETLDTRAADVWIEAAGELALDESAVDAARQALTARLAAMESARPIPATELELMRYSPPQYPVRARLLDLEGWVDVEFVVATDGTPQQVMVTAASHDIFRVEAVRAIEQWQFRPRTFLDRTIEQRAYARIRFALE